MGKIDSIWSRIRRGKRKADAAIDDSEADEVDLSSEERFSVATDEPPARASTTTTTSAAATSTTAATPSRALASSSSSNVPTLVVSSPQDRDDDDDDDDDDDEHYRRLSVSDGVPRQAHASSSNLDAELEVELDGSPSEPSMLADMARELLATTSSSSSSAAGTAAAMPSHTRSSPTLSPQHTRTINWRKGGIIGSGSYGSVYLGLNTDTGTLIAVKQVFVGDDTDGIDELVREVEILRTLSHSSIVQYLGASREASMLNIFLEYVPGGSIHSLLKKFGGLPEDIIRTYTRQILLGLEYLHAHNIVHRDIKGANILVDHRGKIKLTDFGASKRIEGVLNKTKGPSSLRGTVYWMAPEVVRQEDHGSQADIWSLGCTVIEMATGSPPWYKFEDQIAALFHIAKTTEPPEFPAHLSAQAIDFLQQCFRLNPDDRPSASQLLNHPFLLYHSSELAVVPSPQTDRKSHSSPDYNADSYLQFSSPSLPRAPLQALRHTDRAISAKPTINPFTFLRSSANTPTTPSQPPVLPSAQLDRKSRSMDVVRIPLNSMKLESSKKSSSSSKRTKKVRLQIDSSRR